MSIEELFLKYKEISLKIIVALDKDELEQVHDLLSEREIVFNKIAELDENKEKLKKLYEKNYLTNIDEEMTKKFELSIKKVKEELFKIKKRIEMNNTYNDINAKSVYFNKKI